MWWYMRETWNFEIFWILAVLTPFRGILAKFGIFWNFQNFLEKLMNFENFAPPEFSLPEFVTSFNLNSFFRRKNLIFGQFLPFFWKFRHFFEKKANFLKIFPFWFDFGAPQRGLEKKNFEKKIIFDFLHGWFTQKQQN